MGWFLSLTFVVLGVASVVFLQGFKVQEVTHFPLTVSGLLIALAAMIFAV